MEIAGHQRIENTYRVLTPADKREFSIWAINAAAELDQQGLGAADTRRAIAEILDQADVSPVDTCVILEIVFENK